MKNCSNDLLFLKNIFLNLNISKSYMIFFVGGLEKET